MTWVPDSRQAGYLGPQSPPDPLEDEAWTNFLQELVAGVTNIDPTLVRPRWQVRGVNIPDGATETTNWAAIGITGVEADWMPAIQHVDSGDGYDDFQRNERVTLLCSFYGPAAGANASLLRDGLCIDQNLAALRAAAVAVIEVQDFVRSPELFRSLWRDRTDVNVILLRTVRRRYPVLTLLSAHGSVTGEPPGGGRAVESDWNIV
jgi:hypothetical protein